MNWAATLVRYYCLVLYKVFRTQQMLAKCQLASSYNKRFASAFLLAYFQSYVLIAPIIKFGPLASLSLGEEDKKAQAHLIIIVFILSLTTLTYCNYRLIRSEKWRRCVNEFAIQPADARQLSSLLVFTLLLFLLVLPFVL